MNISITKGFFTIEEITNSVNPQVNRMVDPNKVFSSTPTEMMLSQNPTDLEHVKPNKKYVCFAEAHKFAQSLELKTRKEWRAYVKGALVDKEPKPDHIPAHPDGIYKVKGWQGWKYWLGTADKGLYQ